jgi:hypothetical protein
MDARHQCNRAHYAAIVPERSSTRIWARFPRRGRQNRPFDLDPGLFDDLTAGYARSSAQLPAEPCTLE